MPEISLHEYEVEIDQLIEEARYLEALAHVRHIIIHHPHHIGAYYLLGKMLLEADQPNLAVDIFRRALNADPEHLKSRIGIGLAHEQRDDLNAAIWNLERAFELAPANADIADELRRIYGRRDGLEPDHIPISRAGLARLYMRGNLSSRAVDELRNLLMEESKRPDLLGALAEAYWRDGQIVQAAETCQRILDDMPYHRKANLLLGTLWLNSGQEEGQIYLNRSQEVDVDNTLAVEFLGAASPVKHREVYMDRLVYDQDAIDVDQQAEWFKRLEAASASVGISEVAPDMSESDVRLVDITAGLQSQIEIPDWLRDIGSLDEGTEQEGGLRWMSDMTLGEEITGKDTTLEIVESLTVDIEDSEVVSSGSAVSSDVVESAESSDESADWLSEFVSEELAESDAEVPDWLEEIIPQSVDSGKVVQPITSSTEGDDQFNIGEIQDDFTQVEYPGVEAEETPDWLQAVAPSTEIEVEEETQADFATGVITDAAPDIVADVMEISISADIDDEVKVDTSIFEDLPVDEEYIDQVELSGVTKPLSEAVVDEASEEIPDWLQAITPTTDEAIVAEVGDEGDTSEVDIDWLEEIVPETESDQITPPESLGQQEEVSTEIPDWLQAIAPASEQVSIRELSGEDERSSTELDWLEEITADLDSTASDALQLETSEDLPDWLQAIAPSETQATVVAPTEMGEKESAKTDWLEEITADLDTTDTGVSTEEPLTDVPEWLQAVTPQETQVDFEESSTTDRTEDAELDWLKELASDSDTADTGISIEEEAGDVPDWLKTLTPSEAKATVIEPLSDDLMETSKLDWLESISEESDTDDSSPTQPLTSPVEAVATDDDSLAWLEQITSESEQQPETEQVATPEWLRGLDADVSSDVEPDEMSAAESIPDWISELQPTSAESETFTLSEEEIPELLAELEKSTEDTTGTLTPEENLEQPDFDTVSEQSLETPEERDFSGWQAFDDEIKEVAAFSEGELLAESISQSDRESVEERVDDLEAVKDEPGEMFGWDAFGETITEVISAPKVGGDVLSGDDALAWLESLTAGKEEELRSQAEMDSEARMAEILGRPASPAAPELVGELAEEEPTAVLSEPEPEPEVTLFEQPATEAIELEPVAEAEGDVLSGDDALAWLESLTIGKEEELRSQAEMDSEARMAEILGRPAAPAAPEPVGEPAEEEPTAVLSEPEPEATFFEQPVAEAIEPEPVVGEPAVGEPEPEAVAVLEPVSEAVELVAEVEKPAVGEPEPEAAVEELAAEEPEPEVPEVDKPEFEVLEPELEEEEMVEPETMMVESTDSTPDELEEMRIYLKRKRSDHDTRLQFCRALWSAGEIKEAMMNYGTLIKSGAKMGEIYEDLQNYLQTHPKDSDVLRTLGDAYMKDGDLDRALEIYNEAMNTL